MIFFQKQEVRFGLGGNRSSFAVTTYILFTFVYMQFLIMQQ